MVEFRINPNPPRTRRDEAAWLDRDRAALRHLDSDLPARPAEPVWTVPEAFAEPESETEPVPAPAIVHAAPAAAAPAQHSVAAPRMPQTPAPHPWLASFLKALPEPGASWSLEARLEWMRLAEGLFQSLYKAEGRILFVPEPAAAPDDVAT